MKHLLTGVAIAAALAISAPAWAQNAPMKPAAPAAKSAAKPAAAAPAAKRPMMMHRHRAMHASDDAMTDQLNQAELARLQGGAAASGDNRMPGVKAGPK